MTRDRRRAAARWALGAVLVLSSAGSGRLSAALGLLDPDADGDAEGTVRLPDDVPAGEAEVSLTLRWAKTLCDLDPSAGCARNPFATVDVVD